MKKINVLIFPAGEINSVELHDALSHNVNIKVYGASSVDRHGPYVFKDYYGGLPFIDADDFIPEFDQLLSGWEIDCIFPTHDTVAFYLAEHQDMIRAKVITANPKTALICRDKKKTYDLFSAYPFCPEIYQTFDRLPCFIKPREGQGSVGVRLIERDGDIPIDIDMDGYVICEYLPGDELTVDCITDASGELRAVLPRKRLRVLAGVCVSGISIDATEEIRRIASVINQKLDFLGLWYFQLKHDRDGRYKLLEISVRCAGTMCLSRSRGINLPLLSVYIVMGKEIKIFENPYKVWMDRTLISRYFIDYDYDTVYIDYDDTIIENGQVNLDIIRFLYQCRNMEKQIILLTRHETDHGDTITESLMDHAISERLFDEIISLDWGEKKSDHITRRNSVFIDNSYAERKEIHDIAKIPVFDVEGVEVLTDWRC